MTKQRLAAYIVYVLVWSSFYALLIPLGAYLVITGIVFVIGNWWERALDWAETNIK